MNMKDLPTIVTSIIVGMIILLGVFVPVVVNSTEEYVEMYNNTSNSLSSIFEEDVELTLNGRDLEINGQSLAFSNTSSIIISDSFNLFSSDENTIEYASIDVHPYVAITSATINIVDSHAIVSIVNTNDETISEEFDIEWGFVFNPDGDYSMYRVFNNATTITLNNIDQMYCSNYFAPIESWYSAHGTDVTVGDTSIQATFDKINVGGYVGGFQVRLGGTGDYQFVVDGSDNSSTVHPWVFVVPKEVVLIKEGTEVIYTMLSLLPILVGLGLVIGIFVHIKYRP